MYDDLVEALRLCAKYGKAEDALANAEQAANAIEDLENKLNLWRQDKISRWISVEKDGLPSEPNEYLVYVRDGITDKQTDIPGLDIDLSYVTTAYFDPDTCLWNENQEYYNGNLECVNKNKVYYISHWADKPKPPKEANDADN